MGCAGRETGIVRRLAALLAIVALTLSVLAPPGYMVARQAGGVAVVICTGHGPVTLTVQKGPADQRPGKARQNSVCAFASHGMASAPPVLAMQDAASFAHAAAFAIAGRHDLLPGRGLAAPPPPSQGPPILL